MENNNWFFSDEYKKMIENINRITNSISPQFEAIRKANLQLGSILQTNITRILFMLLRGLKAKYQISQSILSSYWRLCLRFNCLKK